MIPRRVTHEHILQAAAHIDRAGVPAKRNSVHYDLVIGGRRYPPKLIISLATKYATGKGFAPADFNAVEAKQYFESHGYEVIDRRLDESLEPKSHRLVMDLVREAGVDVSDWKNFRGGAQRAASNPKYCYEWAFVEEGKVVVLNLWFKNMQVEAGGLLQRLNLRELVKQFKHIASSSVLSSRALRMDKAIQNAWQQELPVRVIVCDGSIRDLSVPNSKASKVKLRMLDPLSWAVTAYNMKSGDCVIKRDTQPAMFVDQFDAESYEGKTGTRIVTGKVRNRDIEVRRRVLTRAEGRCEYCGSVGFLTHKGQIFLETHHVVPLSEDGADSTTNVIALCPSHHREAHHGNDRDFLRESMLEKLASLSKRKSKKNRAERAWLE
jgi:hypothetical protein